MDAKNPIGRPRKPSTVGPKGGKGHTMTARITGDMRESLEDEARRTGRSIGQVAELWMEKGRDAERMARAADETWQRDLAAIRSAIDDVTRKIPA